MISLFLPICSICDTIWEYLWRTSVTSTHFRMIVSIYMSEILEYIVIWAFTLYTTCFRSPKKNIEFFNKQ